MKRSILFLSLALAAGFAQAGPYKVFTTQIGTAAPYRFYPSAASTVTKDQYIQACKLSAGMYPAKVVKCHLDGILIYASTPVVAAPASAASR